MNPSAGSSDAWPRASAPDRGPMFDHVTIRVSDRAASERFYATVLEPLGIERTYAGESLTEWDDFSLAPADDEHPVTRRLHVGFVAPSREHADEFWRAGTPPATATTARPGRGRSTATTTTARSCSTRTATAPRRCTTARCASGGNVDHLWIRVADVAASKRFFETIAPYTGMRLRTDTPERARFAGGGGSFSVLAGDADRAPAPGVPRAETTRPSTPSTAPRPGPDTATTARPASGRSTTRATTARSCSTPTATTSRSSATTASPAGSARAPWCPPPARS